MPTFIVTGTRNQLQRATSTYHRRLHPPTLMSPLEPHSDEGRPRAIYAICQLATPSIRTTLHISLTRRSWQPSRSTPRSRDKTPSAVSKFRDNTADPMYAKQHPPDIYLHMKQHDSVEGHCMVGSKLIAYVICAWVEKIPLSPIFNSVHLFLHLECHFARICANIGWQKAYVGATLLSSDKLRVQPGDLKTSRMAEY